MRNCTILLAPFAAFALALGTPAQAATYNWTPTAAGTTYNWDNAGSQNNWGTGAGGAFPNAVGDVANMELDIAGNQLIRLNQAITLGILNIGDTSSNQTFQIDDDNPGSHPGGAGGNGSLTFDGQRTTEQGRRRHGCSQNRGD